MTTSLFGYLIPDCKKSNRNISFFSFIYTLEIQPPYGGCFLNPAEGFSLRLHQKGSSGPMVILPYGLTDERTTGLREFDMVGYFLNTCYNLF